MANKAQCSVYVTRPSGIFFYTSLMEFEEDKLFMPDISEEVKYVPGVGDFLKTKQTLESFADEAQEEIKKMLKMEGNG